MASTTQVKTYLAYWFQLGKKLVLPNGETLLPQPIIKGDRYSPQFESCWQKIANDGGRGYYLQGSRETIADLFSAGWEIDDCARCNMPVAIVETGIQSLDCLCSDLDHWPNDEVPAPRSPVNSQVQLNRIRARLANNNKH